MLPQSMLDDPQYPLAVGNEIAFKKLRCRHDFEYWCRTCCTIKHKTLGKDVPFELNAPQRRVAALMEEDRRAGRPIRIIMLKARQWGGSTLIQTYMAWLQSCHCRNWNSIICSQVKDTSAGIRGMYTKLLDNYPPDLWEGDEPPRFRCYESSRNVREIAGRGCRVTISSIENQDSVRGADFAMAHLSETAFWRATPSHTPEDLVRAVCGSIALAPNTLIAMESTANGVGNFFHREWMRCRDGHGDKRAVFVPWYEIEAYSLPPDDPDEFEKSLSPYEIMLRDTHGCSPAQINWYRQKLKEYPTHRQMMAEFPTTDTEAFANTGSGLFAAEHVERLRRECADPVAVGEVDPAPFIQTRTFIDDLPMAFSSLALNLRMARRPDPDPVVFRHDPLGKLAVWAHPVVNADYVAAIDVGGRTDRADWSVVAVLRIDGDRPEVVAQWRGHVDHDILAFKAARICEYYNNALLVIEANSLEHTGAGQYVIECLRKTYDNIYCRTSGRVGFHTNPATKEMIVSGLMAAVRAGAYVERCAAACDEMLSFEQGADGRYGAVAGTHDDILMTRAIALHVIADYPKISLMRPTASTSRSTSSMVL